jgi:hypothetical protein
MGFCRLVFHRMAEVVQIAAPMESGRAPVVSERSQHCLVSNPSEPVRLWAFIGFSRVPYLRIGQKSGYAPRGIPPRRGSPTISEWFGDCCRSNTGHKGSNSKCCCTASIECSPSSNLLRLAARATLVSSTPTSGRPSLGLSSSTSS